MADDNILRIGAEFDVGPIIEGTQKAVASFNVVGNSAIKMATEMQASGASLDKIRDDMIAAGVGAKTTEAAITALAASETEAAAAVEAESSALSTNTATLTQNAEASNVAATSTGRVTSAMGKARVEMGALEGSAGMVAGGFARIAAQSATLAPVIAYAFPVLAAVAFLEILDHIDTSLHNAMETAMGFGEAAKKAFDKAREANLQLIATNQQAGELRKQDEIGVEGQAKHIKAIQDLTKEQKDYTAEAANSTRELRTLHEQLEAFTSVKNYARWFAENAGDMTVFNEDLTKLEKQIDNFSKHNEEMLSKIKPIGIEISAQQKEMTAEAQKDAFALTASQIGAAKTAAQARLATEQEANRELLAAHNITIEEYLTRSLAEENEKYRIESEALAKRVALATKEGKATGKDVKPELATLHGEQEAAEAKHQESMSRIRASAVEEIKRRDKEAALADIEAAQKEIEAADHAGEAYARLAMAHADTPVEAKAASIDVETRLTKVYNDQIAALKLKAEVLQKSDSVGNANEIKALNSQIIALDAERESAIRSLRTETTEKLKEMHRQELEDNISAINENFSREQSSYQQDISALQTLFNEKKLTLGEYTSAAQMFAREEYNARIGTLAEEAKALKDARAADFLTEEQYTKKVEALHAQSAKFQQERDKEITTFEKSELAKREQQMQATMQKVANEFTAGIDKMITHQGNLSRTMAQTAGQIELNLINKGIDRVVMKYGEDFAKILASHLTFVTSFIADHSTFLATVLGIETTGDAAKIAKTIAANTVQVASDSGLSFAAGFSSVMEALPFPANVAAAPGVAAAAAAQTMAGATFEQGGIVKAILHEGEMVLPRSLSQFVQTSAASASGRSGGGGDSYHTTTHNHIKVEVNNHGGSPLTTDDVTMAVNKAIRQGRLRAP